MLAVFGFLPCGPGRSRVTGINHPARCPEKLSVSERTTISLFLGLRSRLQDRRLLPVFMENRDAENHEAIRRPLSRKGKSQRMRKKFTSVRSHCPANCPHCTAPDRVVKKQHSPGVVKLRGWSQLTDGFALRERNACILVNRAGASMGAKAESATRYGGATGWTTVLLVPVDLVDVNCPVLFAKFLSIDLTFAQKLSYATISNTDQNSRFRH